MILEDLDRSFTAADIRAINAVINEISKLYKRKLVKLDEKDADLLKAARLLVNNEHFAGVDRFTGQWFDNAAHDLAKKLHEMVAPMRQIVVKLHDEDLGNMKWVLKGVVDHQALLDPDSFVVALVEAERRMLAIGNIAGALGVIYAYGYHKDADDLVVALCRRVCKSLGIK